MGPSIPTWPHRPMLHTPDTPSDPSLVYPPADLGEQCYPRSSCGVRDCRAGRAQWCQQLLSVAADSNDKRLPEVSRACVTVLGALALSDAQRYVGSWMNSGSGCDFILSAEPMVSSRGSTSTRGGKYLAFFGEHRSEIMFGVLVVVLRRDRVAILRFSAGQRQVSLVASLQVLKAIWLGSGRGRYPVLWPSCKRARWRSCVSAISHFSLFDWDA